MSKFFPCALGATSADATATYEIALELLKETADLAPANLELQKCVDDVRAELRGIMDGFMKKGPRLIIVEIREALSKLKSVEIPSTVAFKVAASHMVEYLKPGYNKPVEDLVKALRDVTNKYSVKVTQYLGDDGGYVDLSTAVFESYNTDISVTYVNEYDVVIKFTSEGRTIAMAAVDSIEGKLEVLNDFTKFKIGDFELIVSRL